MNLTTSPIVYLHANDAAAYYCKFNDVTGQWLCDSNQVGVPIAQFIILTVCALAVACLVIIDLRCR